MGLLCKLGWHNKECLIIPHGEAEVIEITVCRECGKQLNDAVIKERIYP